MVPVILSAERRRLFLCCSVVLFIFSCDGSFKGEINIPINVPDLSYLHNVTVSEYLQVSYLSDEGFIQVSVTLPPSVTRSVGPSQELQLLFRLGTGEDTLRIARGQNIHILTGDPDGTELIMKKGSFVYWSGSSGPGPFVEAGIYTLVLKEITAGVSPFPAFIAGYYLSTPVPLKLWVVRDGFAYPVVEVVPGKTSYTFVLPELKGKYRIRLA